MRAAPVFIILVLLAAPGLSVAAVPDCSGAMVPTPVPVAVTAVPAVAYELDAAARYPSAPGAALAPAQREELAVERVLLRLRLEGCNVASVDPGAGYQKKTPFDNTPYRFNAEAGFTAAQFDAWMRERGIRIVNGRAVVGGSEETDHLEPAATTTVAGQCPDQEAATLAC